MGTMPIFTMISVVLLIGNSASGKNMAMETNDVADQFISTTINFIFDLFLRHYTSKLIERNETQILLPTFERSFSTRIITLDIEGAIIANDGWLSNISTIHRTGDADMDKVDNNIFLSSHLGLNDLRIDFNNYDISILGEHQKGKIHVRVGDNSLWLKLRVDMTPCQIVLTDMTIEKLEDIKVEITNLGIFENLTDEITSWVANEVTKWYHSYIEHTLFPELAKVVEDADLCKYWPHNI